MPAINISFTLGFGLSLYPHRNTMQSPLQTHYSLTQSLEELDSENLENAPRYQK